MLVSVLAGVLAFAPPSGGDAASDAEQAYQDGIAAYETSDFQRAIESFSEAFELAAEIEDPDQRGVAMNRLRFNLARSHLGAWSIDQQVEHLRTAKSLIASYREEERRQGRDPDGDVELQRLELELAAAFDEVPQPEPDERQPQPANDDATDPARPIDELPPSRPPLVAGSVLVGLGGASLVVMAVSLGRGAAVASEYLDEPSASGRERLDQRGQTWNVAAGITAGVGGALIVAGAASLAVGIKRRRSAIKPTAQLGPQGFALGLEGRF